MATPPRPPARRPPPGRPAPAAGRGPGARPPGARQGPRKAEKVRYKAVKVEEPRWGRWLLGGIVGLAIILGAVGWYRYLTRPPVVRRLAPIAARPSAPTPPASAPAPPVAAASEPAAPDEPVGLSPKDLEAELRSDPVLTPKQTFDRRFHGREVDWSGTVLAAQRWDNLLRVDLKDGDGMHILAWCETDAGVPAGVALAFHGRLADRLADGFVVDQCRIL